MNLADYDRQYQTKLEDASKTLCQKWKVPEGEQRLNIVMQHFSKLSPEQAYQLLNPEAYRREVEEIQTYKRWSTPLLMARIFLGLAPLILTWLSLSLAVQKYGIYASHQKDQTQVQPLLQAWQDGLLHPLTFFWTGVIDVGLLVLFLCVTLGSLWLEHRARSESEKFALELKSVTDGLMEAVAREGRHEVSSDAEIERIMRYIKIAIADSYKDLGYIVKEVEKVVDKAKETIVKTGATVEEMFKMQGETIEKMFKMQIEPTFTNFDVGIKAFHDAIKDFHTDLHTLDDRVEKLVDASTQIASATGGIVASATQMANSASNLALNVRQQTDISTTINNHLVELNKTEQEMTHASLQMASATGGIVASAMQMANSASNLTMNVRQQTDISTTINNHLVELNKTEQEMTHASAQIASSAGGLAASTAQIASSASNLGMNVRQQTDISTTINNHLVELNKTEQEMTQTLKQTQGEVVREIRDMSQEVVQSAHKLQSAIDKVDTFGKTIVPQLAQQTENAQLFANNAEQVANALQQAAQVFQRVSTNPGGPRWWPFRSKKNP